MTLTAREFFLRCRAIAGVFSQTKRFVITARYSGHVIKLHMAKASAGCLCQVTDCKVHVVYQLYPPPFLDKPATGCTSNWPSSDPNFGRLSLMGSLLVDNLLPLSLWTAIQKAGEPCACASHPSSRPLLWSCRHAQGRSSDSSDSHRSRSCIPKTNYSSILPGIGLVRLPSICA